MQREKTSITDKNTELSSIPRAGRLIALDPGTKRIGCAVCDELQSIARPLDNFERTSWKSIVIRVRQLVSDFDAVGLVIGLPLETDGGESEMSALARDWARKFSLTLDIPVVLQDERVTSYEARGRLWSQGIDRSRTKDLVDSEAASIILSDFLASRDK